MSRERKRIANAEKLAILKRYLVEKVPISNLCDEYGVQSSQSDQWQALLFEHGVGVFDRKPGRKADAETVKDRNTAARSLPALSIASASHSFRTICSGWCRFRRLVVIRGLLALRA